MGFFSEFREFALKGSVVDLAVGVIIGAAFNSIITSLINDVITPLILKPALDAAHLSHLEDLTLFGTVKYGKFISALISFVIVALVLFVIVRGVNKYRKKAKKEEPPAPTTTEQLLTEIRDSLKK
jgi:large conductance mechanosensitive channel